MPICRTPTAIATTLAVVCAVMLGLVTGCTSSKGRSMPSPHHTSSGPTAATTGPSLVQNPLPTKIPNEISVRKDVVQTRCAAIPGGWDAGGTVTNPTGKSRTYKIVVFFTTTSATTLDFATTKVRVAAGKSSHWTASKKFAAQKKMLCPMPGISAS